MARRMPYRRWVEQNKISVRSLFDSVSASAEMPDLAVHQRQFGFTQEDVELILRPMMMKGAEPLGSMGNDAPLANAGRRAPVQLLQAIVRAGDQPAHRPHPGGTRHEPDHVHRQPSQHSGGNAGARPAHQDGAPRHYGRGAQPPLQHPGSRRPPPKLSLQFPEGGDGKALRETLDSSLAESAVGLVRSGVRILVLTDHCLEAAATFPFPACWPAPWCTAPWRPPDCVPTWA